MIISFSIILSFLLAGETISTLLKLSVPGSVIGMVLLTVALWSGLIKDEWIRPAAKILLDHMAFLFVPAGVGLMIHLNIFSENFLILTSAIVISTLVTMAVTGFVQQFIEKRGTNK